MIEKIVAVIFSVLILVAIAIPLTSDMVADSTATVSTVSNEQFDGTNGTAYAAAEYVASVTSFATETVTVKHNATAVNYVNATRNLSLTTPIGQGNANLTITHTATVDKANVSIGSHNLGVLTAATSNTFTVPTSYLSVITPITITFYNNENMTNISNISLSEPYWATTTAYGVSNGKIVPGADGLYLMSYDYAVPTTGVTLLALSALPILLGVLALVFVANLLD